MLEVKDLRFSYGSHEVLKGIDFSLEKGSLTCVLGANGAGKSTLFRCLLQLLTDYTGQVLVDGEDLREMSYSKRAEKIAYIPQSHRPVFNYTVEEVVLMGTSGSLVSGPGRMQIARANHAIERVGLGGFRHRGYAEISGGERQLVLIARAIAQNAEILVMDEPTASLDFGNQTLVLQMIRELADAGFLVVQSTHHPDQALYYGDRVLVLQNGVVAADGDPNEVMTGELLSSVYRLPMEVYEIGNGIGRTCLPVRHRQ